MQTKYALVARSQPAGFFSNYFWALRAGLDAKQQGFTPVFGLPLSQNLIKENYKATKPTWSRFFDVIDLHKAKAELNSAPIYEIERLGIGGFENLDAARIAAKSVLPIRRDVENAIDELLSIHFSVGKKVLGLHFRGRDMYWHPNHPTPPTQLQVIEIVTRLVSESSYDSVYLATDTLSFEKSLKRRIAIPVLTRFDIGESRPQSPIGEGVFDVLFDALALSKAQGLLHADSNVSSAARLFRANGEYPERVKLELGVNPSNLVSSIFYGHKRRIFSTFGFSSAKDLIKAKVYRGNSQFALEPINERLKGVSWLEVSSEHEL